MDELDACFGRFENLMRVAFDETVNTNMRLATSVRIAECAGVPRDLILRTTGDLDAFMKDKRWISFPAIPSTSSLPSTMSPSSPRSLIPTGSMQKNRQSSSSTHPGSMWT